MRAKHAGARNLGVPLRHPINHPYTSYARRACKNIHWSYGEFVVCLFMPIGMQPRRSKCVLVN